jgi:hypothetical protein
MTTAITSLLISGLALLVSCFAAVASWRGFQRAGARVVADLSIREPMKVYKGQIVAGDINLSISDKGLAPIGINNALWLIELSEGTLVAIIAPVDGPEFPMTLSGLHSAHRQFDFNEMIDRVKTGAARARVIFSLGDRDVSTPWRYLPGRDSVSIE